MDIRRGNYLGRFRKSEEEKRRQAAKKTIVEKSKYIGSMCKRIRKELKEKTPNISLLQALQKSIDTENRNIGSTLQSLIGGKDERPQR